MAKRSAPVPTFSSATSVAVETGFRRPSTSTKTLDQMNPAELRAYARSIGMSTATKLTEAADLRRAIRKYQSRPSVIKVTKDDAGRVTGLQGPARKAAQPAAEVTTRVNASVPKAHTAKQRLEPLGWVVKGRAWFDVDTEKGMAEITAVREDETLVLQWSDGKLTHQDYGLWDVDQPQKNNKPASKLPFDPDEVPDRELVGMLQGMTVTWWNALAQSNETAVIDPQKITIEHAFNGHGDETPADRIVKFVALHGGGFRAFRLGALLKIGS